MRDVVWFDNASVAAALEEARALRRPLLVDFWSPTCLGCAKLFALTYQEPSVRDFLAETFVCIKFNTKEPSEWFRKLNGTFAHQWHPDIAVLDARLTDLRRVIGYLPPEDFLAQLQLGLGLWHLHHARPGDALALFDAIAAERSETGAAPEALYWAGVAAYRAGGGLAALEVKWTTLRERYGRSDWALRADCLDVTIPKEGFRPDDATSVRVATFARS